MFSSVSVSVFTFRSLIRLDLAFVWDDSMGLSMWTSSFPSTNAAVFCHLCQILSGRGCVFSRSSLWCVPYHFDYTPDFKLYFRGTVIYVPRVFTIRIVLANQSIVWTLCITVKKEMGTLLILTIQKFKVFISFKFIEVLIYSWIFPFFKAIVNWCVTSSSACRWCIFKSYWFVQVDSVFCYFAEIVDHDRLVGTSKVYYPVISSHGCFWLPSLTLTWVRQCDLLHSLTCTRWTSPAFQGKANLVVVVYFILLRINVRLEYWPIIVFSVMSLYGHGFSIRVILSSSMEFCLCCSVSLLVSVHWGISFMWLVKTVQLVYLLREPVLRFVLFSCRLWDSG